ncbi:AAA family ATPase [Parasedimentitalea huanghaiensis]|uniref:AAA family ATPase n=1 Tax=Parasedimentitalea huanghaiensis TaxID=2682100 RepID=A0A6L6WI08_9RHOB|nr:ATP-binding protein [Zongyanglinia huanghaiensis]MVO16828.1 AAA family ATPase [Zongyanglinia huanghaiensis]
MSYLSEIGNAVRPLTNVAKMASLLKELESRTWGAPGFGVFHGPPGYGKTFGAIFCADKLDAIHLAVQSEWSKKFFLQQLLRELGRPTKGTVPELVQTANEALAIDGRALIIDEADYLISKGILNIVRDLHDGSQIPILLIGMENFPQLLNKHDQFKSRVLSWSEALPADMTDARHLADMVSPSGMTIEDDLLEIIRERHTGNARWIVKEVSHVCKEAKKLGLDDISKAVWGGLEFMRDTAPVPRGGLK